MPKISIVIPVFNEQGNINLLHEEIKAICQANHYDYEIIIIDDGSTDNTIEIVKNLIPVKLIQFRKHFGQTAAMDAGIKQATGDYIITMDGDRQNDPTDLPKLINYLEENDLDAVSGWRKNRQDQAGKKLASWGADLLRRLLINDGVHDSGCTLKIYKKYCFDNLNLYGELHRFIPGLLKIRGYKIGEIVVSHHPRLTGKTKYSWQRIIKGMIDLISVWFWGKYAVRPLHLMGGLGILFMGLGGLLSLLTVYLFFNGANLSETVLPLLDAFLVITGLQLFILGMLADIIVKNHYDSIKISPYTIKEIIENK